MKVAICEFAQILPSVSRFDRRSVQRRAMVYNSIDFDEYEGIRRRQQKKLIACPAIPTLQLCWLATNGTQEPTGSRRLLRLPG